MKLRREVFLALGTVVRADGVVTLEERDGLLEAARASGLAPEEVTELDRTLDREVETPSTWADALSVDERLFVYAAALWLASIDGTVTDSETESVRRLGDQLALGEEERVAAGLAAQGFSPPGQRDVLALARAIVSHGG